MFIKKEIFNRSIKVLSILIICCAFYFSCSKDNATANPAAINNLISQLKSQNPDCTCNPFLNQYVWENKTVYVSSCGGPACDCISIFYDSAAQQLILDSAAFANFFRESSFVKNVWTCN